MIHLSLTAQQVNPFHARDIILQYNTQLYIDWLVPEEQNQLCTSNVHKYKTIRVVKHFIEFKDKSASMMLTDRSCAMKTEALLKVTVRKLLHCSSLLF